MAKMQEFYYPSSDGAHKVHAVLWLPDQGEPRAVIQLVHGISEYIQRYDHFARFLAERGLAVVGSDHLGHGKTAKDPSEYGFLAEKNGWQRLVDDVRRLRTDMDTRFQGLPYFMLGHSMGSFLVRTYLIDFPGTLTGAILSGTGQEPPLTVAFGRAASALLGKLYGKKHVSRLLTTLSLGGYNKQFQPTRTGSDWISRDPKVVDAYVKDPLCRFVPTVGMFCDMMGGLQYIAKRDNLARMNRDTPIYFFSGTKDPVGACGKGVQKVVSFFRSAGVKDVTLKLYPEGRHEMLNELNRDEVSRDLAAWLGGHLRAR